MEETADRIALRPSQPNSAADAQSHPLNTANATSRSRARPALTGSSSDDPGSQIKSGQGKESGQCAHDRRPTARLG